MPRIRTIKPEFWSDEKLAPLAAIDRLVFLGLISMADDAGRVIDNVKAIDGFLFSCSEESSRESLDTLARLSRVTRYTADHGGQRIIQIANWLRHQKIDRPSQHVLPPSRDTRETLARHSRSDLGPRTIDLGPRTMLDPDARTCETYGETDTVPTGVVVGEPALTALYLTIWANRAIAERWGEQTSPLGLNGHATELSEVLRSAGVGWEVARDSIFDQCRRSKNASPPRSVNYFRRGVEEAWGVDIAQNAATVNGDALRPSTAQRSSPGKPSGAGRGALVLNQIRAFISEHQQPGQAVARFIPQSKVRALGADVLQAYEAIGGAERVLGATGEQVSFLIRDFSQALEAVQHG